MAQVESTNSIRTPNDSSRRRFITVAGAVSAIAAGTLAAIAASPSTAVSQCFAGDDSELVQLAKEIGEARKAAQTYDAEILRLSEIWTAENSRLAGEIDAGRLMMTPQQRLEAIEAMPESAEHARLVGLQDPYWHRHDAALERMFFLPATSAEGRAAKATAVLGLMGAFMGVLDDDEDEEYPLDFVKKFLVELGGKPGAVRSWQES